MSASAPDTAVVGRPGFVAGQPPLMSPFAFLDSSSTGSGRSLYGTRRQDYAAYAPRPQRPAQQFLVASNWNLPPHMNHLAGVGSVLGDDQLARTEPTPAMSRQDPNTWKSGQPDTVSYRPFVPDPQQRPGAGDYLWSNQPDIASASNMPAGFSMGPGPARFVPSMGQYRNNFAGSHLVKSRLSQIQSGPTGSLMLPNRLSRQPPGTRSFFGGPRQFTSSRGSDDPSSESAVMAQHLRAARDFPSIHKSNKSSVNREQQSSFPFFAALATTPLAPDISHKLEARLSRPSANVLPLSSMTPRPGGCVVPRRLPQDSFGPCPANLNSSEPECLPPALADTEMSPGDSSKSPVTASSVEDDCGSSDLIDRPADRSTSAETSTEDLPLDAECVPSQKLFQTELTHGQAPPQNVATLPLNCPSTLPLLAMVLEYCDGSSLAKFEMVNAHARYLIRDRLPMLWSAAAAAEEEDPAAPVEPEQVPSMPLSTVYKLRWLSRQGALQCLAFRERRDEYNERLALDQEVQQLAGGNELALRSKQQLLSQARKASQIFSELRAHSRGVAKVLRSMRALQAVYLPGSPEYQYVAGLLSLPWAVADVRTKTKE